METCMHGQQTHPLLQGTLKGGKPCSLGQGDMSWGCLCAGSARDVMPGTVGCAPRRVPRAEVLTQPFRLPAA